jgi:hypothetical protein
MSRTFFRVAGIGVIVAVLFAGMDVAPDASQAGGEKKPVVLPPELAWIPSDAAAFAHLRVAELWGSDLGKMLRVSFPDEALRLQEEIEREFGMSPADLESLTFVVRDMPQIFDVFGGSMAPGAKRADGPESKRIPHELQNQREQREEARQELEKLERLIKELQDREQREFEEQIKRLKKEVDKKPRDIPPAGRSDPLQVGLQIEKREKGAKDLHEARSRPGQFVIVAATRDVALDKARTQARARGQENTYKGKTYYTNKQQQREALHFVNDRTYVKAPVQEIRQGLERPAKVEASGPLSRALELAVQKQHVVAGAQLTEATAQDLFREIHVDERGIRRALRPLVAVRSASFSAHLGKESRAELYLRFADGNRAKRGLGAAQDAVTLLRILALGSLMEHAEERLGDAEDAKSEEKGLLWLQLLEQLDAGLRALKSELRDDLVHLSARADTDLVALTARVKVLAKELQQDEGARQARLRRKSANNLKQIGLALHSYHDTHKVFPPIAICSPDGKPLLSWRVAILPYLEEERIFQNFNMNQAWDGPDNIKLLSKMPKIYTPIGMKTKEAHTTFYQGFIGTGPDVQNRTAWGLLDAKRPFGPPPPRGMGITHFQDGTSNTLLVVEAGEAVPWTKPVDIPYDANKPVPKLGGNFKDGFHVLFADGSVRFVRQFHEPTLRLLITPNDGMPVDHDKLR